MLAGVALGIAAGTKWYGVSSVAVVGVLWLLARLLARRRHATGPVVRDGVLLGALSLLGTLPWLLRNLLLSDNPVSR